MAKFLPNGKIGQTHGQTMHIKGRLVIPMYHPAAALHQPSLRSVLERDFAQLPELIANSGDAPEYVEESFEEKSDPKQLSMF
jgi:DNA polymerase